MRTVLHDTFRAPGATLRRIVSQSTSQLVEVKSDSDNIVTTVLRYIGACKDKRLRHVAPVCRQLFGPVATERLTWAPAHMLLADALTKALTAAAITAFDTATRWIPVPTKARALQAAAVAAWTAQADCVHAVQPD